MNTPNKITLTRILMIPVIMFFYLVDFIPWSKMIAGIIFIAACLTDFLDGYLARKNNQVTTLGKFLDTIADKLLVMSALILLIAGDVRGVTSIFYPVKWLAIICSIIILAREFLVSALRQVAATKGVVLAADKGGKIKAVFQYITLTLYFFYAFVKETFYNPVSASMTVKIINMVAGITLIVLLCVTTILTITSGISYFANNIAVFGDKKEVQTESAPQEAEIQEEKEPSTKTSSRKKSEGKSSSTASKKRPTSRTKKSTKKPNDNPNKDKNGRSFDVLIPNAFEMFMKRGQASTTMLQKHMGIGYPRASKIVDQMEELGIISPSDRTNARKILISEEQFKNLEHLFK